MFVTTALHVSFHGTSTSTAEREVLRLVGFVHVTGLKVLHDGWQRELYIIGEKLTPNDLGKHGYNNGKTVIVTTGGEVWLKAGSAQVDILQRFCPNGSGAFVPLSNGESVPLHDILARFANSNHSLLAAAA